MAVFPGSVPPAGTSVPTDSLAVAGHTALHNGHAGEIRALAQKLGTGASTPTADKVLAGDGAGTSSWSHVNLTTMVSGVLPVANGGTGSTNLTFPTGPDTLVARTSSDTLTNKTLTTPVIGSFTNATHNHQNNAGGGTLSGSALIDKTVTSEKLNSTVAFYATNAESIGNGASVNPLTVYTEVFDYGNDFASGEFVAPYDGAYQFNMVMGINNSTSATGRLDANIQVNGVALAHGHGAANATNGDPTANASLTINLTAGDTVDIEVSNNTGGAATLVKSSFSGFLIGRI